MAEVRSLQSQSHKVNGRSTSGDRIILPWSSISDVSGIKTDGPTFGKQSEQHSRPRTSPLERSGINRRAYCRFATLACAVCSYRSCMDSDICRCDDHHHHVPLLFLHDSAMGLSSILVLIPFFFLASSSSVATSCGVIRTRPATSARDFMEYTVNPFLFCLLCPDTQHYERLDWLKPSHYNLVA